MRSLLCAELLDFVGHRFPAAYARAEVPPCDPPTCLGSGHVRVCAEALARHPEVPASLLLQRFGKALFGRLVHGYPAFLVGIDSTIELLARYETHVVAEVAKLAPSLPLPSLDLVRRPGRAVEVVYRSPSIAGRAPSTESRTSGRCLFAAGP